MKDSQGREIVLCWLCNGKLEYVKGKLIYSLFELPNKAEVKMHKVCAKDFKEYPDSYWSQRAWSEK